MSLPLSAASAGVFRRALINLDAILTKAEASAEARKIDPVVFLGARLAPDMAPLTRQVQMASDSAKGAVARLGGVPVPSMPDTETTFAELHERIARTIAFIDSVDTTVLDGAADREVVLKMPSGDIPFTGQSFLLTFALPNFMFHATMAYAILRHNGVALGKMDFLGGR
jgi:hypothetical protein